MDDYLHGRTFIDPKHVQDGGVTPEHVRRWRLLQELQVPISKDAFCWTGVLSLANVVVPS